MAKQGELRRWVWPLGLAMVVLVMIAITQGWPEHSNSKLAAGLMTVDNRTSASFEQPAEALTPQQLARHVESDLVFDRSHVPLDGPSGAGLGPLFIANSCVACHVRNGRGQTNPDESLVRVAVAMDGGGSTPVPGLGSQVQNRAVWGSEPEALVQVNWRDMPAASGQMTLRKPVVALHKPQGGSYPPEVVSCSLRVAPPLVGLGLLESVPEDQIVSRADPNDRDGDGISGRAHWIETADGSPQLGRFGWKAIQTSLRAQSAAAYNDDMGLTTPAARGSDLTADGRPADISNQELDLVTYYSQTLGAPRTGRSATTHLVRQGQRHFEDLLCSRCHMPQLATGGSEQHVVEALSNQTIWPYTDLLLHDMGAGLDDGVAERGAASGEWRTAPLWGIGLTKRINPGATYLHDGRARSLDEAIRWHGGEAEHSKDRYLALSRQQRGELIRWLEQL